MSKNERVCDRDARRAIYIDFEGTEVDPPSLLGVLVEGEFDLPAGQGGPNALVRASKTVSFTTRLWGRIQAQADWTHASNTIALGIYPAGCKKQQLGIGACKPLAYRHPPGTYDENVVVFASDHANQYVLGIQNHGAKAESGAYHVIIVN